LLFGGQHPLAAGGGERPRAHPGHGEIVLRGACADAPSSRGLHQPTRALRARGPGSTAFPKHAFGRAPARRQRPGSRPRCGGNCGVDRCGRPTATHGAESAPQIARRLADRVALGHGPRTAGDREEVER